MGGKGSGRRAGARNRKRGIRPQIRDAVPCPACGAKRGQPCVNYTGRRGTPGTPSPDVHSSRWYAWTQDKIIRGR